MFSRVEILFLLIGGLVLFWAVINFRSLFWKKTVIRNRVFPELTQGTATLLFFTGEYCTICKVRQAPAISKLQQESKTDFKVIEIDAANSKLSQSFGILSLPSTVLLDTQGHAQAINYGFATTEQLHQQLLAL
jgi:thiol-disulfide isomerase/thioredoxin